MKKISRFVLIGLCCTLVFSYTGQAAVKNGTLIADVPGEYTVPALFFPHADIETFGLHSSAVAQANQGFKKSSGDGNDPGWKTAALLYHQFSNYEQVLDHICHKNYLSFIYPSHNFW